MKKLMMAALMLLATSWSLAAVNINTATADELKTLPGIGPSKAEAIVQYRNENGKFKSVDELTNVKGIGSGILAKLKDEATVAGDAHAGKKAAPLKVKK